MKRMLWRAFDGLAAVSAVLCVVSFLNMTAGFLSMRRLRLGPYSVYLDGGKEVRIQELSKRPLRPGLFLPYLVSDHGFSVGWVFLFSLAFFLVWFSVKIAQDKRVRASRELRLCPSCGYDLRASPGRCPECGTVPAGKAES